MNVYIISHGDVSPIPESQNWHREHQINLIYLATDEDVNRLFSQQKPDAIVTCGENKYPTLCNLPLYIRGKWIHIEDKKDIKAGNILCCANAFLNNTHFKQPTISVFTSAFESGERIVRAYESIAMQDETNWEWVIMDDSKSDETWNTYLVPLTERDCRVRIYRKQHNDGFIGSVKRDAAMLCRGRYLVEFDHDDEFSRDDAFALLRDAFDKHPEVALIGSDCSEIYENNLANHAYPENFGMGFCGYYCERYQNRWINVCRTGPLNGFMIRHIVGVYNHVRAWRASVYRELGGHDQYLNVADDYDLILRTFIKNNKDGNPERLALLPVNLYLQYRTHNHSNFTLQRNGLIQYLVAKRSEYFENAIVQQFKNLNVDDIARHKSINEHKKLCVQHLGIPKKPAYQNSKFDARADLVLDPNPNCVSIIMSTFNRPKLCIRAVKSILAQTFQNWMLYIVGDHCPALDSVMDREEEVMHDPRIRYWNLVTGGKDGAYPKNYAAKLLATSNYIAYLDDDNEWTSDHLQSLHDSLHAKQNCAFAFSSFTCGDKTIVCKEPRLCRMDTSTVLHLRELFDRHGYWKPQKEVGYANDWELFERWVKAREIWTATLKPTLIYNNDEGHQNMDAIYDMYNDQAPRHMTTVPKTQKNTSDQTQKFNKVIEQVPEVTVYRFEKQ